MKNISASLEAIANSAEKDTEKTEQAIKVARDLIKNASVTSELKELDTELSIWQSKLAVILKEPVGKKGMAKHARFWAEKLRTIHV